MARTCNVNNCFYPVFGTDKNTGKGYCSRHQTLRTDKKPREKYFTARGRNYGNRLSFGFENQIDLFNWLWEDAKNEKGDVICSFTGERLNRFYNTELWYSCFAHILAKGKYTYWKLNPKNVVVCLPDFHRIVDQGSSLDRANHPNWDFRLWDQRKEELKIEYDLFKKQNLLA